MIWKITRIALPVIIMTMICAPVLAEAETGQSIHGKDISEYWSISPDNIEATQEASKAIDIDVSDLRQEIDWLRNELKTVREERIKKEQDYKYGGGFEFITRFGNVISYNADPRGPIGPENNYRLKFNYYRDFGAGASFDMTIDTMDGGFDSSVMRDLATSIIDIRGSLLADLSLSKPVLIKGTFGPGDVVHRDTGGVVPSEDYRIFRREYPSFMFATELGGFDVSTSYIARVVKETGEVATSEVGVDLRRGIGMVGGLGEVEWLVRGRYVFVDILDPTSMDHDSFQGIGFTFKQSENIFEQIFFDMGSSPSNSGYFEGKIVLNNIAEGSTDVLLSMHSIGSAYRKPFINNVFMPLNIFDKYILNDTVDIGVGITHRLSNRTALSYRSDIVMNGSWKNDDTTPGTSFTNEITFSYFASKDFVFEGSYRIYNVPSGTGQFGDVLPKVSDLMSVSLKYLF